jgi:2-oxoglutarate ferredoxin oxidoreductase subunit gamma
MDEQRIIISGFGGQGVLMIGKLLATAGMEEGLNVSWLPSYGPEMRGGTANCHVILSHEIIGAPIVTEATALFAMNLPSLDKFESVLVSGGLLLSNTSLIPRSPLRRDLRILPLAANDIATAHGSLKVANVVMLGAFLAATGALRQESIIAAIKEALGESKQHLLDINLKALQAGIAQAEVQGFSPSLS